MANSSNPARLEGVPAAVPPPGVVPNHVQSSQLWTSAHHCVLYAFSRYAILCRHQDSRKGQDCEKIEPRRW